MRNAPFFAIVFVLSVFGQTADNLTFEVASVKRTPPPEPNARVFFGPPRGGPGTPDPGQITWSNAALRNILMTAYDVQTYQVTAPDWMNTERYDIVAKIPEGATKAQVNVMWQNLLKERFGMVLHHESKDFQVDELTVAKGGSKLKETELPPDAQSFTPSGGPPKLDKNGFPEMNGSGAIVMISLNAASTSPNARMVGKGLPSAEIASRLAGLLRRPVIDKTGLTGKYDFTLEYTPDMSGIPLPPPPPGLAGPVSSGPAGVASDPPTSIPSAVEKQLGLKLTSTKGKLDVIVVDRAEKVPTEN
ncbi:MAG: TIGR03435 family protein [Acidobacteriia bacterium]|nr:TIGR03435 family protein [Terriglobia bacterium]